MPNPPTVTVPITAPPTAEPSFDALTLAMTDRATPCRDRLEFSSDSPRDQATARALCRECPILTTCHEFGRAAAPHGMTWGGVTYVARRPGRPRKVTA